MLRIATSFHQPGAKPMRYEMTPESRKVLDFVLTKPRSFTYAEMQQLTGVNDVSRLRGYIMTALRRLRKQKVWYASERGIGYRLLAEDEKNPVQDDGLQRVRRKTKRIDKDQDLISYEGLSRDGKLHFSFNTARIGLLKSAV